MASIAANKAYSRYGEFEISVNMDIRMTISFEGDRLIVLLDVDHHDKPLK